MKKTVRVIMGLILTSLLFSFTGCLADAVPDLGTGFPNSHDDTSGGTSSGTGWGLCKNTAYDIFDMQVWGDGAGTFDYENKSGCGRFTVTSKGGGWIGGGLVIPDNASGSKNFDFNGVAKMKFEIRGNINPQALCIAVQNNGGATAKMYPSKSALKTTAGIASLSETEWSSVEFNVSGAASDKIINAFCIIAAGDWGASFNEKDWWEIRNLDWVDASGNSVTLTVK